MHSSPPFGLSGRQRDFLASYPDEVTVYVVDENEEGAVLIRANGELSPSHRQLWVPPEGFLDQPTVTLSDPEWTLDGMGGSDSDGE